MKDEQGINSGFNYYQSDNEDAAVIKAGFLARQYEYGVILEDLVRHPGKGSVQHYLLLGRRGSGKSTLLKRLQVEIDTDEDLSSWYIAINPAEEQANIYRLFDLLEEVAKELECRQLEIDWPDDEDPTVYTRNLFSAIHHALDTAGKKLVLLLDNIDRIFESLGEDTAVLRAYLQNNDDIKIIGGSTRMTEHFWSYDQSFYEFFRVLRLQPLDSEEVRRLLFNWSDKLDAPLLREFVEKKPGQLEAIRILTDGLPRTLQFFVNILLTNNQETGYDYLRLIMDKVTPLYQERLNNLPPAQRKIVLQMAFYWEAAGAGELAKATRMENRIISAQLNQLISKGIADKIETKTKNHLYRLSERFFNLWLIFTQGNARDKRRAKYLTIFLENFYDESELNQMAREHLNAMQQNTVSPDKAILLTKAYSQSSFITSYLRGDLIEATHELSHIATSLKSELPFTTGEMIDQFGEFIKKGAWGKAHELANSIEQEDGLKEYLLGWLFERKDEILKAEDYYAASLKKGNTAAAALLVSLFLKQGKFELAEELAQIGVRLKDPLSIRLLCAAYYEQNKEKEKALYLIKQLVMDDPDSAVLAFLPVIKAWSGDFDGIEEDTMAIVRAKNPWLGRTLLDLAIHHQTGLIQRLFNSEEFGQQLVDQFPHMYFAIPLMITDGSNSIGKLPPELRETIDDFILTRYERRDFYYHGGEAEQYLRRRVQLFNKE